MYLCKECVSKNDAFETDRLWNRKTTTIPNLRILHRLRYKDLRISMVQDIPTDLVAMILISGNPSIRDSLLGLAMWTCDREDNGRNHTWPPLSKQMGWGWQASYCRL